jgi:hypothetical protein
MNNAAIALEKLQRLQAINPDGQYCITMSASGHYRVVDRNEKSSKQIDAELLLKSLLTQTENDFLFDH